MTSKILPLTATVEASGETITIRELGFGQLPAVARHMAAIFGNVGAGDINIPLLIADGGEDIMAVLAMAAGKQRSWLDGISMEEGVELLTAVIAVNKESFAKKLLPALTKLTSAVAAPASN